MKVYHFIFRNFIEQEFWSRIEVRFISFEIFYFILSTIVYKLKRSPMLINFKSDVDLNLFKYT